MLLWSRPADLNAGGAAEWCWRTGEWLLGAESNAAPVLSAFLHKHPAGKCRQHLQQNGEVPFTCTAIWLDASRSDGPVCQMAPCARQREHRFA